MWCFGLIERPRYRLLAHEGWHSKEGGGCRYDAVSWGRSVSWSAQCGSLSWTARCGVLSWLRGHVIGCVYTKAGSLKKVEGCQSDLNVVYGDQHRKI